MTEINVAHEPLSESFAKVIANVDVVDTHLSQLPTAPDAGIASELVGFVMAASIEAAATNADTFRALVAIAEDVIKDFSHNDEAAADELRAVKEQLAG